MCKRRILQRGAGDKSEPLEGSNSTKLIDSYGERNIRKLSREIVHLDTTIIKPNTTQLQ